VVAAVVGGCLSSDGVRMHNQASAAPPASSAQRDRGTARRVVLNLSQADLKGDGIDYTVADPPGVWSLFV